MTTSKYRLNRLLVSSMLCTSAFGSHFASEAISRAFPIIDLIPAAIDKICIIQTFVSSITPSLPVTMISTDHVASRIELVMTQLAPQE